MEIILTVIAVIIVVAGVISNHNRPNPPRPPSPPSIESTPTPLASPKPSAEAGTPSPTTAISSNISEYIYPGSTIVSSSDNSLFLTSSADPDVITVWYKDKIQNKGFSSKAFAETKANDKVLNKLGGDNGQLSIQIEISKDSADSQVKITVSLSSK